MQIVDSCCDKSKNQTNMENNMVPYFKGEKTVDLKARLQGDLVTLTLTTRYWRSKVN